MAGRQPGSEPPRSSLNLLPVAVGALVTAVAIAFAVVAGQAGNDTGVGKFFDVVSTTPVAATTDEEEEPKISVLAADEELVAALSVDSSAQLEAEFVSLVDAIGLTGVVSIAVTDLSSGTTASYRSEAMQRSGCLVNFFVLALALRDVANGYLDFAGVQPLIDDVAGFSDAAAAFELYLLVGDGDLFLGLERVSALIEEIVGPGISILDHPPGYELYSLGVDENNYITAAAMNAGLSRLYLGELLPEPWGTYLLDLLAEVDSGLDYLLADLPDDILVSHKNGWFAYEDGNVENDAALVRFDRGGIPSAYVITYMSDSPDAYASILLAKSVTRLVYTAFTGTSLEMPIFESWDELPEGELVATFEESLAEESPFEEAAPVEVAVAPAEEDLAPAGDTVDTAEAPVEATPVAEEPAAEVSEANDG